MAWPICPCGCVVPVYVQTFDQGERAWTCPKHERKYTFIAYPRIVTSYRIVEPNPPKNEDEDDG